MEYKIDYDVRMGIIINPYFNVRDYGWAMFEGLQATMAERVTSILASDNMFMERIQENMEFTLLPTYRIWLEYQRKKIGGRPECRKSKRKPFGS